jgi:ABC-type dipeptide/oligopeptide/nickel transport system permease component
MESTLSYLMRRLLWVPPVLFAVTFATFALARLGPGDPVRIAAGQFRDPEAFARIREARGLDKPVYEQYVIYMRDVVTKGDFGDSFRYRDVGVNGVLFPAMWRSAQYGFVALVLTVSVGVPLGIFAAKRQGTWQDPAAISTFLFFNSIPSLVMLPFLAWFFCLYLGILPARGWPQPQDCVVQLGFLPTSYQCVGVVSVEAIIPIIAMTLPVIAGWARFTRAFVLDVMKEDYIRTAQSKGLSEYRVITRHVMRNALLPLSTMIAFALSGLMEGAFFVETLTGIPGAGRLAIESIGGRDYDMIMAFTIITATAFVMTSIFIDIAYTFIDPRIRYGARRN